MNRAELLVARQGLVQCERCSHYVTDEQAELGHETSNGGRCLGHNGRKR